MRITPEPLALTLYRRHLGGESVEQLADDIGIPAERVERRLRVAELYYSRQGGRSDRACAEPMKVS